MNHKHQLKQPTAVDLIDFSLCGRGAFDHSVYKWLLKDTSFRQAASKVSRSGYFQSLRPGNMLKLANAGEIMVEPGLHAVELLTFAQRVSYCLGHYYKAKVSPVWKGSASRRRESAARAYKLALRFVNSGFGPYAEEDQRKLVELLSTAQDYICGKHLSTGFRLKGGAARPVGILIRELVIYLDYFNLRPPLLTSIVTDLVSIVEPEVNERTVQRHIKGLLRHLTTPTDQ